MVSEQLKQYAREFARLGGLSRSPARAEASRANGKLGGRPKRSQFSLKRRNKKATELP